MKKLFIGYGAGVSRAYETAQLHSEDIALLDLRFVKPLDQAMLHRIHKKHKRIITVEDGTIQGGFGSAILEFAAQNNYSNPTKLLGIPDMFIAHGNISVLQETISLDPTRLAEKIKTHHYSVIKD